MPPECQFGADLQVECDFMQKRLAKLWFIPKLPNNYVKKCKNC